MGTQSYHDERGVCGDWCEDVASIHKERLRGVWDLIIETIINMG